MFKILKILFKTILVLAAVLALIAVYSRYIEPYRLTVSELTVENKHLAEGSKDITIAVFADTHFGPYYTLEDFEKAIEIITKDAGTHFDPGLVEIFLQVAPKIEEYFKREEEGYFYWV